MAERDLSKWAGWVAAIVAVALAFGGATVALGDAREDVAEIKRTVDTHKVQPAHNDSASRLNLVEERQRVTEEERRDFRQDVKDMQEDLAHIQRTVDALCIASPRCQPKDEP